MRPERDPVAQRRVHVLDRGPVGQARLEAVGILHRVKRTVRPGDSVVHAVGVDLPPGLSVRANDRVGNHELGEGMATVQETSSGQLLVWSSSSSSFETRLRTEIDYFEHSASFEHTSAIC
jgi:hypothetical protein